MRKRFVSSCLHEQGIVIVIAVCALVFSGCLKVLAPSGIPNAISDKKYNAISASITIYTDTSLAIVGEKCLQYFRKKYSGTPPVGIDTILSHSENHLRFKTQVKLDSLSPKLLTIKSAFVSIQQLNRGVPKEIKVAVHYFIQCGSMHSSKWLDCEKCGSGDLFIKKLLVEKDSLGVLKAMLERKYNGN